MKKRLKDLKMLWLVVLAVPLIVGRAEWILPILPISLGLYYLGNYIYQQRMLKSGDFIRIFKNKKRKVGGLIVGTVLGAAWIAAGVMYGNSRFSFAGVDFLVYMGVTFLIFGLGSMRGYMFALQKDAVRLNDLFIKVWSYKKDITYIVIIRNTIIFFSRSNKSRSRYSELSDEDIEYLIDFFAHLHVPIHIRGRLK